MKKLLIGIGLFFFCTPVVLGAEICPTGSHLSAKGESYDFSIKTAQSPAVLEKIRFLERNSQGMANEWKNEKQHYVDQINSKFERNKKWADQWLDTQKGRIRHGMGWGAPIGDSVYSGVQQKYNLLLQALRAERNEAVRDIEFTFKVDMEAQSNRLKQSVFSELPEYAFCACDTGRTYLNNRCVKNAFPTSSYSSPRATTHREITKTPQERQWSKRQRVRPTTRNRRFRGTINYRKMLTQRRARRTK